MFQTDDPCASRHVRVPWRRTTPAATMRTLYSWRWLSPCFPDARFLRWNGGQLRAPRPHVRRGRVRPSITALGTATNERHRTQDPRPAHPRSTRHVPRPSEGPCDASWRSCWPSRSRHPCACRPSVRFACSWTTFGRACKLRCGGSGRRTSSEKGRTSAGWRLVARILSHACAVQRSRTTPCRTCAHVYDTSVASSFGSRPTEPEGIRVRSEAFERERPSNQPVGSDLPWTNQNASRVHVSRSPTRGSTHVIGRIRPGSGGEEADERRGRRGRVRGVVQDAVGRIGWDLGDDGTTKDSRTKRAPWRPATSSERTARGFRPPGSMRTAPPSTEAVPRATTTTTSSASSSPSSKLDVLVHLPPFASTLSHKGTLPVLFPFEIGSHC